jgi:hypothetical protein
MKKSIVIAVILSVAFFAAEAQKQEKQKAPDQQSIVNKEYDEQGNLIKYDSTFISSWSTDTSFHFGFPADSMSFHFPGIEQFMHNFWNDSALGNFTFPKEPFTLEFQFSPFGEGDFGDFMPPLFADSMFSHHFPFHVDSMFFNFGFNQTPGSPPQIDSHFFEDFEDRFKQHFFQFRDEDYQFPGFKNEEHREEWEQLIEQHRQELKNLRKKWQQE